MIGDYADDAIDGSMDEMMRDNDESYYDPIDGRTIRKGRRSHCKYCGEVNLHWGKDKNDKFRLKYANNSIHYCDKYNK